MWKRCKYGVIGRRSHLIGNSWCCSKINHRQKAAFRMIELEIWNFNILELGGFPSLKCPTREFAKSGGTFDASSK